ncbi:MAG TPA: hypothetical protein VIE65_16715, partial [Methylobacter sp.]
CTEIQTIQSISDWQLPNQSPFTADGSGRYQPGNAFEMPNDDTGVSLPDVNGALDAHGHRIGDPGRLHEGVLNFTWGQSVGKGPDVHENPAHPDVKYNVLRSISPEPVDRFFNDQWNFDPKAFVDGNGNYRAPLPPADQNYIPGRLPATSTPYNGGTSMLFHKGYPTMTGSAGCQTFPDGQFQNFAKVLEDTQSSTRQPSFYYLLKNM